MRDALDNQGLARSQIEILDAPLKLRQVCCDPRLVPLASAKLEHLMAVLPQRLTEGRRVLLFTESDAAELLKPPGSLASLPAMSPAGTQAGCRFSQAAMVSAAYISAGPPPI